MKEIHGTKVANSTEKVVSKKGYVTYRCPANSKHLPRKKCGKVVTRLRDHLERMHRMTDVRQIKSMMAKAEPLLQKDDDGDLDDGAVVQKAIKGNREQSYEEEEKRLSHNFIKWLQGLPYLAASKTAVQHYHQSFKIWQCLSYNFRARDLLDITALNGWVEDTLHKQAPGTIMSYLGSYIRLVEYLMEVGTIRDDEMERARRMLQHTKVIRKSISNKVAERRTVVEVAEIRKYILSYFRILCILHSRKLYSA